MGEGEGTGVTMGFFRVIGIPDFKNNISGALFDNNYFVTMRFVEPEERFDLVELLINGQPTTQMARYSQVSGTNYYTGIIIYADRLTNGANTLQLRSTFRIEDVSSSDSPEVVLSNAVVSVVFSNVTTFPTWPDIAIGDSITLEAKTVHPIAAWQFDIYDSDDLWVKSLAGETTNGSISVEWNLRDNNNNSRNTLESDPFFYSEMTVLPLASPGGSASGASTTRPTPFIANDFPNRGAWLTAYLDRDKRTAGPNPQFQGRDMATNLWTAPWALADYPILFAFLPYANNTNRSDMTNQAPRNAAWETLRGNLYDRSTRNFYYTGHGTKSLLGADWDDPTVDILKATGIINPAGSRANLSSQWLRDNVTFNKYGANRYRFVFLDGCQTSTGDWPIAFGIPKQTNNLAYYVALNANKNTRSASRPSAFVGWEVVVGGSALWGNTTTAAAFRKSWIGLWGNTFNAPSVSQSLIDGNNNAGWISETLLKDSLRVYGYTALRFRDYNRKTDWPPTP